MAKLKPNTIRPILPIKDLRPIEVQFNRLDASHQHPTNRLLHFVCIPVMVFGVLALAWAIPFPQFKLIAAYKGYFNWASFVIAFWVYYTLKMSPLLSYLMLFVLFAFSYGAMLLANWGQAGGLPLIWTATMVIAVAASGQFIGGNIEGNKQSFEDDRQLFLITPIWALYCIFKKLGLKY